MTARLHRLALRGYRSLRSVELTLGDLTLRRLDEAALAAWLEDYSLADLWQMNVLGGRP